MEYGEKRIAIETANRCMYQDKQNVQKIREIMALDSLSKSWKDAFKEHLKKMGALY
ncbi:MAG: 3-alpha domain-containing protein [Nitrospinales bacterium]